MVGIVFPSIDPVLFSLGPIKLHWYGLAYFVGIILGYKWATYISNYKKLSIDTKHLEDFIPWLVMGILIGGRLGHIFIYDFSYHFSNPLKIFKVWEGGMSFHGGLIGVTISTYLYCKKKQINLWQLGDIMAAATPIGLFLGRITNFINCELYGKITDVSWGVIFPNCGNVPRHPTQIYEALLEGILLWLIVNYVWFYKDWHKTPGRISGLFLLGYGVCRIFVEFFKEPEYILYLPYGIILSIPMAVLGSIWMRRK